MRYIVVIGIFLTSLYSEIDTKWASNKNCEACHQAISKYWETSRHANSHFSKNILYKKSIEHMAMKNPQYLVDELKVKCAKCHNPRISKNIMSDSEKILLSMEDEGVQEEFAKVLNSEQMKHGINCIVCHNIEEIHLDKAKGSQGLEGVKFGTLGVMYGPFEDAHSPHHKSQYKEYFSDESPTLCFTCHYSHANEHGLEVYSTGKEYESVASKQGCKVCHMSPKKEGVASEFAMLGEKPKTRMVRDHRFASVNNSTILQDYLEINVTKQDNNLLIVLHNKAPHSIPTGYGLREVVLSVEFYNGSQKLDQKMERLTTLWHDEKGKPTLPFLATKKEKDTRIAPQGTQHYTYTIPNGAKRVEYRLSYRFIGEEMAKMIGLSDPFFTKEYKVKRESIELLRL